MMGKKALCAALIIVCVASCASAGQSAGGETPSSSAKTGLVPWLPQAEEEALYEAGAEAGYALNDVWLYALRLSLA